MRWVATRWVLLGVAVILALLAPATAAAVAAPKGFEGAFELQGTNGYKVSGLIGSTGKTGVLILAVDKNDEGATISLTAK